MPEPHAKLPDLYFTREKLKIKIHTVTDGTETHADVFFGDVVVGRGVSRRRKGEKRNDEAGQNLAVARAFADLAAGLAAEAEAALE
jgi:hypothetical protein